MTYTYAILEVSPSAYQEIHDALERAGYAHCFEGREGVIDMHGLALRAKDPVAPLTPSKLVKCRIACRQHDGGRTWYWVGLMEPLEFSDRAVADRMRYEFSMQDDTRLYMTVEADADGTFKEPGY